MRSTRHASWLTPRKRVEVELTDQGDMYSLKWKRYCVQLLGGIVSRKQHSQNIEKGQHAHHFEVGRAKQETGSSEMFEEVQDLTLPPNCIEATKFSASKVGLTDSATNPPTPPLQRCV